MEGCPIDLGRGIKLTKPLVALTDPTLEPDANFRIVPCNATLQNVAARHEVVQTLFCANAFLLLDTFLPRDAAEAFEDRPQHATLLPSWCGERLPTVRREFEMAIYAHHNAALRAMLRDHDSLASLQARLQNIAVLHFFHEGMPP